MLCPTEHTAKELMAYQARRVAKVRSVDDCSAPISLCSCLHPLSRCHQLCSTLLLACSSIDARLHPLPLPGRAPFHRPHCPPPRCSPPTFPIEFALGPAQRSPPSANLLGPSPPPKSIIIFIPSASPLACPLSIPPIPSAHLNTEMSYDPYSDPLNTLKGLPMASKSRLASAHRDRGPRPLAPPSHKSGVAARG